MRSFKDFLEKRNEGQTELNEALPAIIPPLLSAGGAALRMAPAVLRMAPTIARALPAAGINLSRILSAAGTALGLGSSVISGLNALKGDKEEMDRADLKFDEKEAIEEYRNSMAEASKILQGKIGEAYKTYIKNLNTSIQKHTDELKMKLNKTIEDFMK